MSMPGRVIETVFEARFLRKDIQLYDRLTSY